MELKFLHFYPDLMSLYGSYANVWVLKRYLEGLGHTVTVEAVRPGDGASLSGADFLYMGAGAERATEAVLEDFARYGEDLRVAAEDGVGMLFAGSAMVLLGQTVTGGDGVCRQGVGLGDFTSTAGRERLTGDVYGHTDLYPEAVVGFMNKSYLTAGVETPLLTSLDMGWGNAQAKGPEGFRRDGVFASQLTGPILVKNPRMLEAAAAVLCARRGVGLPEERPRDAWAEQAYAVTEEQLRLRIGGNHS